MEAVARRSMEQDDIDVPDLDPADERERTLFEPHRGHEGVVLDAYLDRERAAAQIDRLLAP